MGQRYQIRKTMLGNDNCHSLLLSRRLLDSTCILASTLFTPFPAKITIFGLPGVPEVYSAVRLKNRYLLTMKTEFLLES